MDEELERLVRCVDDELQRLLAESEKPPPEALAALHARVKGLTDLAVRTIRERSDKGRGGPRP